MTVPVMTRSFPVKVTSSLTNYFNYNGVCSCAEPINHYMNHYKKDNTGLSVMTYPLVLFTLMSSQQFVLARSPLFAIFNMFFFLNFQILRIFQRKTKPC